MKADPGAAGGAAGGDAAAGTPGTVAVADASAAEANPGLEAGVAADVASEATAAATAGVAGATTSETAAAAAADAVAAAADAAAAAAEAAALSALPADPEPPLLSPDDAVRMLRDVFGDPSGDDPHVLSGDGGAAVAAATGGIPHLWRPPTNSHVAVALREREATRALLCALAAADLLRALGVSQQPLPGGPQAELLRALGDAGQAVRGALGGTGGGEPFDTLAGCLGTPAFLSALLLQQQRQQANGGATGDAAADGDDAVTGPAGAARLSVTSGLGPLAVAHRLRQLAAVGLAEESAAVQGGFCLTPHARVALCAGVGGGDGGVVALAAQPAGQLLEAAGAAAVAAALVAQASRRGGAALAHVLPLRVAKAWRGGGGGVTA